MTVTCTECSAEFRQDPQTDGDGILFFTCPDCDATIEQPAESELDDFGEVEDDDINEYQQEEAI